MKITKKSAIVTISITALLGLVVGHNSLKASPEALPQKTKTGSLFTPENFSKPENQLLAEIINLAIEKTK